MNLSERLKESADRIAGYKTGRLFDEKDTVSLQLEDGAEIS
jgi:hypothetical protein